jgi:uncharacterized protein YhaN
MPITEDKRIHGRIERWFNQRAEEGQPVESRSIALRAFIAGWQARLDAALEDFKAWGTDDTVVQDHLKNAQAEFDRVYADWWKMRGLLQQKQNVIDAWHLATAEARQDRYAVRDGKTEQRLTDLPLWKRISMQRKELRSLHHEIGWRDEAIKRKDAELATLKQRAAELEAKIDG